MDALEDGWLALAPADASPTRQFAWMRSIAEAFCPQGALRICVCERGGRIEAIAPLVLREAPRRLEILGLKETGEPPDVPFGAPEALEHLLLAIADSGTPLAHDRVPAGSQAVAILDRTFRRAGGLVRVVPTEPTPAIDLDAGWVDPEAHFDSDRRSDLRRMSKRAASEGEVTFQVVEPRTAGELESLLDEAWEVEAAGWKGKRGSALARNVKLGTFYRSYARRAWANGILRLAFMRIGGVAVAMQLVVQCDRRWWLLKIGFDERYKRCAPGTLLLVHTIGHAAREGLAAYEFLGNPDSWSMQWARTVRPSLAVKAYPFALRALGALRTDIVRAVRKRLKIGGKPLGLCVPVSPEAIEVLEVLRFVPL